MNKFLIKILIHCLTCISVCANIICDIYKFNADNGPTNDADQVSDSSI